MENIFDNIATNEMKNIESIFKNMSNEFDNGKDFLPLDKINYYKNQTMAIVKSMDEKISADNQQPGINEFLRYVLELTVKYNADFNNSNMNNHTELLVTYAKELEVIY